MFWSTFFDTVRHMILVIAGIGYIFTLMGMMMSRKLSPLVNLFGLALFLVSLAAFITCIRMGILA